MTNITEQSVTGITVKWTTAIEMAVTRARTLTHRHTHTYRERERERERKRALYNRHEFNRELPSTETTSMQSPMTGSSVAWNPSITGVAVI